MKINCLKQVIILLCCRLLYYYISCLLYHPNEIFLPFGRIHLPFGYNNSHIRGVQIFLSND